jgi:hypothetical protein
MEIRSKVCVCWESARCIYLSPLNKTEGWTAVASGRATHPSLHARAAQPLLFHLLSFHLRPAPLHACFLCFVFRRERERGFFFFFPQLFLALCPLHVHFTLYILLLGLGNLDSFLVVLVVYF